MFECLTFGNLGYTFTFEVASFINLVVFFWKFQYCYYILLLQVMMNRQADITTKASNKKPFSC